MPVAKILIVEDETTLAETLAENLAEEGYEVLTADDGETGLSMIRADLRMDLTGRRVYRGNEELHLSHKEFDLLSELMRNQGAVLSRDLILTKVWGYEYFGDKRTVDVHIRWLREKIENDPSDPQRIATVRGVGYRFEG